MAKKQSALSVRDKRTGKNVRHIPDDQIDFSDIPQSTDAELRSARKVGRPKTGQAKQLIAIRIDPKLLFHIRKIASKKHKPYQTFIHELLEEAMEEAA